MIKKGALLGGTVMWVTPMVQTVGMSRALAQTPSDVCEPTPARRVHTVAAGTGASGSPSGVLVAGDGSVYSLGVGGTVSVQLVDRVFPHTGVTAVLIEVGATGDTESGDVFVSDNGTTWYLVGSFTTSAAAVLLPVDPSMVPTFFEYIEVRDTSTTGNGVDIDSLGSGCQQ